MKDTLSLSTIAGLYNTLKTSKWAKTGSICPYCHTVFDDRFDGCNCDKGVQS